MENLSVPAGYAAVDTKAVSVPAATTAPAATPKETFLQKVENVFKIVGHDAEAALSVIVKYVVPVEKLIDLLFPGVVGTAATAVGNGLTLIQNAVVLVEQKYAAMNHASETGPQKLADVLTLTESAVTSLLAQAGITADTAYVTNLINTVVGILNVQQVAA
jgi:hypothetical protein